MPENKLTAVTVIANANGDDNNWRFVILTTAEQSLHRLMCAANVQLMKMSTV